MGRLINLDELLKFPIRINHYDKEHGNEHFVIGIETVLEYAENLPVVDAVPVVRCKDCLFLDKALKSNGDVWCRLHDTAMRSDSFCSFGRKRGANDG